MWWLFRHLRFVLFTFTMEFVTANDQCRTEVNVQGMALKRSVFKRWSVAAPHLCDVKCGQEITCQSYNYNRKYQICELNNRTRRRDQIISFQHPENFLSAPAWFYIRRLNGRGEKSKLFPFMWFLFLKIFSVLEELRIGGEPKTYLYCSSLRLYPWFTGVVLSRNKGKWR